MLSMNSSARQARRLLEPARHTMLARVVAGQRVVHAAEPVDQILEILRAEPNVGFRLQAATRS